jgi:hypothetical protein
MTGAELRRRIDRLKLSYAAAAPKLGLSLPGLNHQMRGERAVSRQTALLLWGLERWSEKTGVAVPLVKRARKTAIVRRTS